MPADRRPHADNDDLTLDLAETGTDADFRYFPRATEACPTYAGDSEWHPLVDGAAYFAELAMQLDGLGPDDAVLIAGLTVDPTLDLHGREPADPGYLSLADRLAGLAAAGTCVRVLIAGRVLASSVPSSLLGDWHGNAGRAQTLRAWTPPGTAETPLAGRVLIDFAGALSGSNHQKAVAILRDGALTAFVGGIDLEAYRWDSAPHDRQRHRGARWGWHDAAVRLRGPAAERVWRVIARRWAEAATLPRKRYLPTLWSRPQPLNPGTIAPAPEPPPAQQPVDAPGTEVRVLWSAPPRKFESLLPGHSIDWDNLPATGVQQIFETLTTAIAAARRYVYLEDQYLAEYPGGRTAFELYPALRAAAQRGVKVVLVGSGTRDPEDPGINPRPINRRLNRDLRDKIADRLTGEARANLAVFRIEQLTVHAKLVLIDDEFACIGSANLFSRSMAGIDNELSSAVQTDTDLVRDLRVQVWAEHLRTPVTEQLRPSLDDLDTALGIWDARWLPPGASPDTWRRADEPAGFAPAESVLRRFD